MLLLKNRIWHLFISILLTGFILLPVFSLDLQSDLDNLTDNVDELDRFLDDNLTISPEIRERKASSSNQNDSEELLKDSSGNLFSGMKELTGDDIPKEYSKVSQEYKDGLLIHTKVYNLKKRKIIEENLSDKELYWMEYFTNGVLLKKTFIKNDVKQFQEVYNKAGKLIEKTNFLDKTVSRYNSKGDIVYKGSGKKQKPAKIDNKQNPMVKVKTTKGSFYILVYEKYAPVTAANFIYLVENEFYNGTRFHRMVKDVLIQGGCPYSKKGEYLEPGTGNPGYLFNDEFHDKLSQVKYMVSMANSGPNTNGSQFFINLTDNTQFKNKYSVFGKVVKGTKTVNRLKKNDEIISIEVVRKRDREYNKPEKVYKTK